MSKMGENLSDKNANVMACIQRIRRFLSNPGISPTLTVVPLMYLMRPLLEKVVSSCVRDPAGVCVHC